jgi:hypothetical protein
MWNSIKDIRTIPHQEKKKAEYQKVALLYKMVLRRRNIFENIRFENIDNEENIMEWR